MLKRVMIRITSRHTEVSDEVFSCMFGENDPAAEDADAKAPIEAPEEREEDLPEDDTMEIYVEGRLKDDGETVRLSYKETEESGMKGSTTVIEFRKDTPYLVTMMRDGEANATAFIFEKGERNICVYQTPYMPFELCVHTLDVRNALLSEGILTLDYIIEFRGAKAEHNLLEIRLFDSPASPRITK